MTNEVSVLDDSIISRLRSEIRGEVHDSQLKRAEYSSDASNYRLVPSLVVVPVDTDDLLTVLSIAREMCIPITMRGGGTSVAGNAISKGIVVDLSVHLNRIIEIDPENRLARVQPGVVLATLQREAAKYGLRFGPDPSTLTRATIGGAISNNACGPHAMAYGKSADQVISLDVIDGQGRRFTASTSTQNLSEIPQLQQLVDEHLATIRLESGRFGRQISGYSLEYLLPEKKRNLAAFLSGTEGTLVTILEATVRLVPIAPAPALLVLGYPSMSEAGDDVPKLIGFQPLAMEGLDSRLVEMARAHWRRGPLPKMPAGQGWLMVEVGGSDLEDSLARAQEIAQASSSLSTLVLPPGREASALWQLRADGSGYAGRTVRDEQAWPGWEDAAVPPQNLGRYMREIEKIMKKYELEGVPFGHFGDGCIHVRIDFPFEKESTTFRSFITEASDLVVSLGGSLSGEHGDGRARSEMLTKMYSPQMIRLFEEVKGLFDPLNILNPGVIAHPRKIDEDLRRPSAASAPFVGGFSFNSDAGDFTKALHRCVGLGKCKSVNMNDGFMCPSYRATKNETDVTRGRARVLQEAVQGTISSRTWRSGVIEESLDLCLSCKACASDCPAEVDMARYKSEFLFRKYKGRIRPRAHYLLGQLPRWTSILRPLSSLINPLMNSPLKRIILPIFGIDRRRRIPTISKNSFLEGKKNRNKFSSTERPEVVLWVDSFSDSFSHQSAESTFRLLETIGFKVVIPEKKACCGLTWISTGQLTGAKKRLNELVNIFTPYVDAGLQIVGIEPSCIAVLRSDLLDLFPNDPRALKIAANVRTLAETLLDSRNNPNFEWKIPDLSNIEVVVQPHCHHHSVIGFEADRELLESSGVTFTELSGCCGLAGNFGMERGHYEVSQAVAELALLPAIRNPSMRYFIADGFSCRTQAEQLVGIKGITLPQLLQKEF